MSDLAIMGSILGGVLGILILVLFILQEREAGKRALELKMFQMKNIRIVQQLGKSMEQLGKSTELSEKNTALRHEEHMTYFQGIMQSL